MPIKVQELGPSNMDGKTKRIRQHDEQEQAKKSGSNNREPLMLGHTQDNSDVKVDELNSKKTIAEANAILKRQFFNSKPNSGTTKTTTTANNYILQNYNETDGFDGNEQKTSQTTGPIVPSVTVFLATFGALLGALSMGLALGYTAPAFVDMERDNTSGEGVEDSILDPDPNKRESQKSLIGSTLAIGALVAALASEPCNNLFGRRIPLILCGIPFVIGWLLLTFANNLAYLVLGRLIIGACCGIACGTAPTYVVEIAPPQIRGALGTCFQLMVVIGNLLASIFGIFLSWRMLAAVSLIPGIGMTMMMLFMPESPQWLVSKQRKEDAQKALRKFRSGPIDNELNEMVRAKIRQQQESSSTAYSRDIIQSSEFLKPLGFALGLMFFQQFTGINAVLMYQSDIFKKASPNSDALMSTIWVCLAQVIATIVCSLFVDKLGRRLLLWVSGAGCMVTLVILGTYSHLAVDDKSFQQDYAIVPLISLILFITFFSFGFGPIPWMMIPELASSRVRSLIASIGALFAWTGAYIVTASMKPLMSMVGDAWTYWILSIICAVSILFIIVLPETKATRKADTNEDDRA